MEVIIDAKERQAAEANKNATILLQELDQEKVGQEGGATLQCCIMTAAVGMHVSKSRTTTP